MAPRISNNTNCGTTSFSYWTLNLRLKVSKGLPKEKLEGKAILKEPAWLAGFRVQVLSAVYAARRMVSNHLLKKKLFFLERLGKSFSNLSLGQYFRICKPLEHHSESSEKLYTSAKFILTL